MIVFFSLDHGGDVEACMHAEVMLGGTGGYCRVFRFGRATRASFRAVRDSCARAAKKRWTFVDFIGFGVRTSGLLIYLSSLL